MDEAPLPDMFQADLDDAGVDELFTDLAAHADVQHIRMRDGPTPDGCATTLGEARAHLLSGEVSGVQIIYRFDGEGWLDTLMRTDAGIRLVRVRQP